MPLSRSLTRAGQSPISSAIVEVMPYSSHGPPACKLSPTWISYCLWQLGA